jgi:tetratricopeptide (TPR) repeat protein
MASKITEEEIQQLLRTVEMFEAITDSQPEDYQSFEILKEAYNKLGRQADSLRISKKLASIYVTLGQISQAILEYEGILQECPNDASAIAALAELEAKTSKINVPVPSAAPSLAVDSKPTPSVGAPAGAPISTDLDDLAGESDRILANALGAEKLLTPQAAAPLLQRLKTLRAHPADRSQPLSLCHLMVNEQFAKMEDILMVLSDKSGLPYLPLSIYDVDRDIASLLPTEWCWKLCLVPFDSISRSVLIATANPFAQEVRQRIATMLKQNVFWYVSSPADIVGALQRAHGLIDSHPQQVKS